MVSRKFGAIATGVSLLMLAFVNPAAASSKSAPPPPEYQAEEIDRYINAHGDPIILRRGYYDAENNKGLGYDKIVGKHNLRNFTVLQETAENPDTVEGELGNAWVHRSVFILERCDNTGCHEVDRRTVRMIIDYDPFRLKPEVGQIGIVTTYCEGEIRCVDWINSYGGVSANENTTAGQDETYRITSPN